jgi:chloride channel protein, CIC family
MRCCRLSMSNALLRWRRRFLLYLSQQPQYSETALTLFFALFIGIVVGATAVGYHNLISTLYNFFFHFLPARLSLSPHWFWLLVPLLGGGIQALLIALWPDIAAEKGIVEVMKVLKLKGGVTRLRTVVFQFVGSALNMGTGGPVGPEGPAAQIGAGVGSLLGQFFHLSEERLRVLVAAGAGAAIAAVFNAPLAGVFFAMEVILLNELRDITFGILVLSSVTGAIITRIYLTAAPVFVIPDYAKPLIRDFPWFLILGVVCGILSVFWMQVSSFYARLIWQRWRNVPRWVFPLFAGLAAGVVALWFPRVLGIGYEAVGELFTGSVLLRSALLLVVFKLLLTPLNIESGGMGGTFAPSLFLGAMLGFGFGVLLSMVLHQEVNLVLFTLVGMGSTLASLNGIPITAIIMLFELTRDYDQILPVMVGVVGAVVTFQLATGERSIYLMKLHKAGLMEEDRLGVPVLATVKLSELLRTDLPVVKPETTFREILNLIQDLPYNDLVVKYDDGTLAMITLSDMRSVLFQTQINELIVAADMAIPITPIRITDQADEILDRIEKQNVEYLPVVDGAGNISGLLTRHDLLHAMNQNVAAWQLRRRRGASFK